MAARRLAASGDEADGMTPIRSGVLAGFVALLFCVQAPLARAHSDAAHPVPPAGLMWNRTGLPAVFPLQVKTPPGQDYLLTLLDAPSGKAALAAYIKGGAVFKVLVPPGVYRLRFATGANWQGEDDLFGPGAETEVFELRDALRFETRGLGIKAGHIVSLLNRKPGPLRDAGLKDQLICQSFRFDVPRQVSPPGETAGFPSAPRYPKADAERFTIPRRDVRSRYCGY